MGENLTLSDVFNRTSIYLRAKEHWDFKCVKERLRCGKKYSHIFGDKDSSLVDWSNQFESLSLKQKKLIITECVMYSCDMCLEFQRKSDGLLTSDWIEHITKEAGEALKIILPRDFNDTDIRIAIDKVQQLMRFPATNLQEEVDRYYNRI